MDSSQKPPYIPPLNKPNSVQGSFDDDLLDVKESLFFTKNEDKKLLSFHKKFYGNWDMISYTLNNDNEVRGRLRNPRQCRDRYDEILRNHTITDKMKKTWNQLQKVSESHDKLRNVGEHILRHKTVNWNTLTAFKNTKKGMTSVNQQRQACKKALRASLSELDDTSPKAIMQNVHKSHRDNLIIGRTNLGVPPSVITCKILTPRQIIELRKRKHILLHKRDNQPQEKNEKENKRRRVGKNEKSCDFF